MASATTKSPISIPRWATHINLNNFLDQDTYLLVGQNRATLKREAEGYLAMNDGRTYNPVRKLTYVYRSPSEKLPTRLGQFFDATLAKSPNRREGVLAWYKRNTEDGRLFEPFPTRREVLDRYDQHTKICPDSFSLVQKCDAVMKKTKIIGLVVVIAKLLTGNGKTAATLRNPFVRGMKFVSIIRSICQQATNLAAYITMKLVQTKPFLAVLAATGLVYYIAFLIKREFYFKVDEEKHRQDVEAISSNWADL